MHAREITVWRKILRYLCDWSPFRRNLPVGSAWSEGWEDRFECWVGGRSTRSRRKHRSTFDGAIRDGDSIWRGSATRRRRAEPCGVETDSFPSGLWRGWTVWGISLRCWCSFWPTSPDRRNRQPTARSTDAARPDRPDGQSLGRTCYRRWPLARTAACSWTMSTERMCPAWFGIFGPSVDSLLRNSLDSRCCTRWWTNHLHDKQIACMTNKSHAWQTNHLHDKQITCMANKSHAWQTNPVHNKQITCMTNKSHAWQTNHMHNK